MRALITGANGFLGRAVVDAFLKRGHAVRAMVRPSTVITGLRWTDDVEVWPADLRVHPHLEQAFDGVDVLIHLAAVVLGDDATHFASTIGGTERLLNAMARSKTRRIVLASSLSVYDWLESSHTLDEEAPPPRNLYESGAYAIAKTWQERIARRMSVAHSWDLTVLRPGFVWGRGGESPGVAGPSWKHLRFVVGPWRRLPLTYVANCADVFVKSAEDPRAIGETFNVVDGHGISAWRYAGEIARRFGEKVTRIPVPYSLARLNGLFADAWRQMLFKEGGKLPGILRPRQLAYMRPLRFSDRKLRERLGWIPPIDFEEALRLCFNADGAGTREASGSEKDRSVANASGQQQ